MKSDERTERQKEKARRGNEVKMIVHRIAHDNRIVWLTSLGQISGATGPQNNLSVSLCFTWPITEIEPFVPHINLVWHKTAIKMHEIEEFTDAEV